MTAAPPDERPLVLDLPHGLHRDVPHAVYHARVLGLASKSTLDHVRRSPAHYLAAMTGPEREDDTPALAFGSALHCRLFEPERFERSYAVAPDCGDKRTKEGKALWTAWKAENEGRSIISAEDNAATRTICEKLMQHPLASRLFTGGDAELTVRWKDPETSLECKARTDYYLRSRKCVVDLKTAEDGRANAFRHSVAKWGYHRQEAMYRDAFDAVGEPIEHFVFVAVEKVPPFAVAIFMLDAKAVAKGRDTIRQDLRTLAECLGADQWPGYAPGIQTLSLPDWSE